MPPESHTPRRRRGWREKPLLNLINPRPAKGFPPPPPGARNEPMAWGQRVDRRGVGGVGIRTTTDGGNRGIGRVPPLRSGPGCALRRARYRRAQRSRAHGAPPQHPFRGKDSAGGPPRSRPSGRASLTRPRDSSGSRQCRDLPPRRPGNYGKAHAGLATRNLAPTVTKGKSPRPAIAERGDLRLDSLTSALSYFRTLVLPFTAPAPAPRMKAASTARRSPPRCRRASRARPPRRASPRARRSSTPGRR